MNAGPSTPSPDTTPAAPERTDTGEVNGSGDSPECTSELLELAAELTVERCAEVSPGRAPAQSKPDGLTEPRAAPP